MSITISKRELIKKYLVDNQIKYKGMRLLQIDLLEKYLSIAM